jgi:DNA-binding NarL/FixJ family response regulator
MNKALLARIVIADDHELTRTGVRGMLTGEEGLEIVGEASNGSEAVALCRQLRPDLLLTDARMPVMDGLAATRAVKQELPDTKVIIITLFEDPNYLFQALKAGAAGYLLKDASQRDMLSAIRHVLNGGVLLTPELSMQLMRNLAGTATQAAAPVEPLTKREREVLALLAQGQTNREIAQRLHVSVGTAKIHVEHIIAKLDAADRTNAAVRAFELGLLSAGSHGISAH